MTTNPELKPRSILQQMMPYTPGKPIWEVQQDYGLTRVIKLASNENPLGPSPKALAAMTALLPELHRYPDSRATCLLEALADRLDLQPSQLIVSNGADELITLISEAFLDQEDEVIVPEPSFSEYEFGGLLMEARIVKVPLGEDFTYLIEHLLAAVTPRTKIMYLCSPNNPTGTYLPEEQLQQLLAKLPKQVLVVLDAAYAHFTDAEDYTNGFEMLRSGAQLLILQTFSKIYGLAGIRAGFAAGPEAIIKALLQVKEPFNVNALAQAAAVAALGDEAHLQASRQVNTIGREQLRQGLLALGIPVVPSQANFLLTELGEQASSLYDELLRSGIIVRSGKGWGLPRHVRISVGTEEENAMLLTELARLMHS